MTDPPLHTGNPNPGSANRLVADMPDDTSAPQPAPRMDHAASVPEASVAAPTPASDEPEFYVENGLLVLTAACHLKRGHCCGSGCRHCPYEPRHVEGTTKVRR